jgi:hypothetical protein
MIRPKKSFVGFVAPLIGKLADGRVNQTFGGHDGGKHEVIRSIVGRSNVALRIRREFVQCPHYLEAFRRAGLE